MNVNLEICIVEWMFSLFSSIIPIEIQIYFYNNFFVEGWRYFYKMCISIILSINIINQQYNGPEDVYIALKLGKYTPIDKEENKKQWKEILNKSDKLYIDY